MKQILFERISSCLTILNPFNGFLPEEHVVEVRKGPLLGDTSVYNASLKDKALAFYGRTDPLLLNALANENAGSCIFCGHNVTGKTARYPSDLLPEGRVRKGSAVLFANLFSLGAYHPVIALGAHFLMPSEFTPTLLADGLEAAQEYLGHVYDRDPSAVFTALCSNYLLPAGASLVHPHMQMLITPVAYSYHARMFNACRQYHAQTGSSYFGDLAAEEKQSGERFVTRRGNWHWIAAFSPVGSNEFTAIHDRAADMMTLPPTDLLDLAIGISRVLSLYERLGHVSFNYALYSVRQGRQDEGQRCIFKIVSRQNLYPNYRNDDYFLQKLLQTELIFNLPEELAGHLRGAESDSVQ